MFPPRFELGPYAPEAYVLSVELRELYGENTLFARLRNFTMREEQSKTYTAILIIDSSTTSKFVNSGKNATRQSGQWTIGMQIAENEAHNNTLNLDVWLMRSKANTATQGLDVLLCEDEGGAFDAGIVGVYLHDLQDFFGTAGSLGKHGQAGRQMGVVEDAQTFNQWTQIVCITAAGTEEGSRFAERQQPSFPIPQLAD